MALQEPNGAASGAAGLSYADVPPPIPNVDSSDYEEFQNQTQRRSRALRPVLRPADGAPAGPAAAPAAPERARRPHRINFNNFSENLTRSLDVEKARLKNFGLKVLNARQHFLLTICRDSVMVPSLIYAFQCFRESYSIILRPNSTSFLQNLLTPSCSEVFLTGLWCLVASYLAFSVIDGLMIRWIVTYQTTAAILRVLSLSLFLIAMEQAALQIFSPDSVYTLHSWIIISCVLTGAYIIQNFVTSNLDLQKKKRERSVDYYNITVYAVVPIGLASFVSMCLLLRSLLILRLDVDPKSLG